jgi:pyrimidine operon attenuation protein/uracil phosphoribosyltransferase
VEERERRTGRKPGAVVVPRARVMTGEDVARALRRIAHEVVEKNHGSSDLVVVGLQRGGVPFAERLAALVGEIDGVQVPAGTLDVAFYRDDIGMRPVLEQSVTRIPVELTGRTVLLVDDVLYTGRTVRAALDALADHGRARAVQLAVLVDRGHRELPIRPDFVGKNLPTRREELVQATLDGVVIADLVEQEQPAIEGQP